MGRPPCCDKDGVKKGPWTPEEDIMLVSYLQEHGPGNWRAVPTNTGLRRCSKSCRLRWTNYLRPGIKRGSFTDHEQQLIIQLQALLGNKWAAIASYLTDRTDNDIKNYWNTHLKKKLNSNSDHYTDSKPSKSSMSKGQWEKRLQSDIKTAKQALHEALSPLEKGCSPELCTVQLQTVVPYASSTENIARLLQAGWMKNSNNSTSSSTSKQHDSYYNNKAGSDSTISSEGSCGLDLSEAYDNLFGFESFDSSSSEYSPCTTSPEASGGIRDNNADVANLSMVENWLLQDNGGKDDFRTSFSCFYQAANLL